MSYVGCVGNLSDVLVYPWTSGWEMREGQPVFCGYPHGVGRTQEEVRYRSRHIHDTFPNPRSFVILEEEKFTELPALSERIPAHTVDLAAMLVCSKLLWPRTTIYEVPASMPQNRELLMDQLNILVMKGILEVTPDDSTLPAESEQSILTMKTSLSTMGRTTARFLVQSFVSPHSAHLLGQLLDPDMPDSALSPTSEAVVNAILSLIAVTETCDGVSSLNKAIDLWDLGRGPKAWYSEELRGIGAGQAWRGPIWLALAIWQRLRSDPTWRDEEDLYDDGNDNDHYLTLNKGQIAVHLPSTFDWDRAFQSAVDAAKTHGLNPPELSDTAHLTDEEMLAVEKALIRAYLDKLICVRDAAYWSFEAHNVLSGRNIERPSGSQATQVWWLECQRQDYPLDEFPIGQTVFAIYTHMTEGEEMMGHVGAIPADVTYVSGRAVQLVLDEVGMSELITEYL